MYKLLSGIGVTVVILCGLAFWFWEEAPTMVPETRERKPSIVATFYPLAEFARLVGGEQVTVRTIVPPGAEPHEYEPTPQDILAAYQADIFLLNGAGLDGFADKIRPELERRGITVINMSERVTLLPGSHGEEAGEEDHHDEDASDPHFWLDPVLARTEVETIHAALVSRDSAGKAVYDQGRDAALAMLAALDRDYAAALSDCALDTVVTSHSAFAYMAARYGFTVLPISGLSPEAEPSPRRLAEIASLVRDRGIKHIFFETLLSPEVAETLARETGATTLLFNPLEGLTEAELAAGKNYRNVMEDNLANLITALRCQP